MSDLHTEVQVIMADAGSRLKKKFPDLEFIYFVCPFSKQQMKHLSSEQKLELEKRMVRAANDTFWRYLTNPDPLSEKT